MDVTFPDDLTTLTDDELTELVATLEAEFDRLHDEGSRDVPLLTQLADQIDAARGESTARENAEVEAEAAVAELANRVHPADEAVATDAPDDGDPDDEPDEEVPVEDTERELVTASARPAAARRPSARAVGNRSPRPSVGAGTGRTVTITAAADVPDLPTGARVNVTQVAQGFHDRARGLNDGGQRVPVARVHVPYTDQERLGQNGEANLAVMDRLLENAENAPALVASGGWCAPSSPIFDLFDIGDADGLIDLPSAGAVRGGVLVPSFYTIGDVAGALWNWTEAQDIAAVAGTPTKPCLRVPCPTWTDVRLEAEGLCVTHGNLSDRAFPALTTHFVNQVMNAHLHRLSAAKTAKIAAGATPVAFAGENSDAAGDLLSAIGLQAADLRSQYRAARTRSVDALLPDWTIEALRASVAKRAGVDLLSVTDAQVVAWLSARGIRAQFLSDYQPLYAAAPKTDWPATLEFLLFFTGAYLEADGGEIDLGVVRDSTLNETNDFTAAWSEQFFAVAQVGPTARKVTVDIGVDGVTGCCPAPVV
jgi:hypothetical protein